MNICSYLQELIDEKTWSGLSSSAHLVFLYLLSYCQKSHLKLKLFEMQKKTGLSETVLKKACQELSKLDLIEMDWVSKEFSIHQDLDFNDFPAVLPPTDAGHEPSKSMVPSYKIWGKFEDEVGEEFGPVLGGALLTYYVHRWNKYLEAKHIKTGYGYQMYQDLAKKAHLSSPLAVRPEDWIVMSKG
jgi:hypothetical protein